MQRDETRLRVGLRRTTVAACLALVSAFAMAACGGGAPPAETAAPPAAAAAPAKSLAQGGEGKLRVMVVTGGHYFLRDPFFDMLDSFGADITYTHVEQPAAYAFFDPKRAANYDVFLMYEWAVREPSPELKANLEALLKAGKGFVIMHHALASYSRNWPEYTEFIGSSCENMPTRPRGVATPQGGFFQEIKQHVSVVDKEHPITKGVGDAYDTLDEIYVCPFYEDSVHPLLRTDWVLKPEDHDKYLNPKTPYTNMVGWYKAAENSPVVGLQGGHDDHTWNNPVFRKILLNSLKWAGSQEGLAWAKANPQPVFNKASMTASR